jgi:hypothetical protein
VLEKRDKNSCPPPAHNVCDRAWFAVAAAALRGEEVHRKFGLFYALQLPKPLDSDQWHPDDEWRLVLETLEQIEFADKLGFDYIFAVEHDFLEEYAPVSRLDTVDVPSHLLKDLLASPVAITCRFGRMIGRPSTLNAQPVVVSMT